MCSKIDRKEKFQESEFLPSEWWYCFEEKHTNPEYDGLVIAKSGHRKKYTSFDRALRCAPIQFEGFSDATAFYRSVGLNHLDESESKSKSTNTAAAASPSRIPAPHESADQPWTFDRLYRHRCGKCPSCNRDPCEKCHLCRKGWPRHGCLRRVRCLMGIFSYLLLPQQQQLQLQLQLLTLFVIVCDMLFADVR